MVEFCDPFSLFCKMCNVYIIVGLYIICLHTYVSSVYSMSRHFNLHVSIMCVVCIVSLHCVFIVCKFYVCSMFVLAPGSVCVCDVCGVYDGSELCVHCIYL